MSCTIICDRCGATEWEGDYSRWQRSVSKGPMGFRCEDLCPRCVKKDIAATVNGIFNKIRRDLGVPRSDEDDIPSQHQSVPVDEQASAPRTAPNQKADPAAVVGGSASSGLLGAGE